MGVDVSDLRNRSRSLHANWWQWRPTIELILSLDLFDGERLDQLSDGFGEFTETETRQLAAALEDRVLSRLPPGVRVMFDGTVTAAPDDGTFHRVPEEQHRNYATDYDWLIRFIAFCKESAGVYVC